MKAQLIVTNSRPATTLAFVCVIGVPVLDRTSKCSGAVLLGSTA